MPKIPKSTPNTESKRLHKDMADALKKPSMGSVGNTGLVQYSGYIYEEPLRELRGADGVRRYKEMWLSCTVVWAAIKAITLTCESVKWAITSEEGEEDPRLEYFEGLNIRDHVSEALNMLVYGWSYFWIQLKRDENGRLVIDKLDVRSQDTLRNWDYTGPNGELVGMIQLSVPTYLPTTIPLAQSVHYRTMQLKDNPEGWSYLRPAWSSYYYWKNLQMLEAISLERGGAGFPVMHMPPGATTDPNDTTSDAAVAAKQIRNVRIDEQAGMVEPDGWTFRFEPMGDGAVLTVFGKVIERYESRILMSMLMQFLMLGQKDVGTQALSTDQTDFATMAVSSIADNIAETFTKQVVRRLLIWNGQDPEGVSLTHTPVGDRTAEDIALFLQKVGSMLTWTPTDEAWLREVADLPEVDLAEMEAERARRDAMAQAIAGATARKPDEKEPPKDKPPMGDKEPPEDEEDKLHAEQYAALTEARRRKFERKMQTAWAQILERQQKKIVEMAKEAKRDGSRLV